MERQNFSKVERFLKLGYSKDNILRVLESLDRDAQTNDILEELIKTQSNRSLPGSPKLVARGCSPGPGPGPGPGAPRTGTGSADREPASCFRPVVIDGSNVAMSHGDKKVFSCQGLQLAVSWFWDKGLRNITVFIPLWRKEQPRPEAPITDQHILHQLEQRKILVYTPSRCLNGKRVVCYDDRYIVRLAFDLDGIIVSNDNYRDLQMENPQWKKFIEDRLLMYTFANNKFMPPDDPLGRNGPNIDDFLRKKPRNVSTKLQHCPYGKKCTYGVKCKFYHPERVNQSQLPVADELRALREKARTPAPPRPDPYASPGPPPAPDPGPPRASPEPDEALGSLESCVSRLGLQESAYLGRPVHSFSSGVASYDCSGPYGPPRSCPRCSSGPWTAWTSCPAAPAAPACGRDRIFPAHGYGSLPGDPWGSDPRKDLRSQLSTLFPKDTVGRVMSAYPHVSDVSEMVALIQSHAFYRDSF